MTTYSHGIEIDLTRDSLFDELGIKRLRESYMRDSETSPQERFAFIATTFATDTEHAKRMYDYISKHWFSLATPILSFGRDRWGLPISCYLPWVEDTAEGLVQTWSEVANLSMLGGGVGIGFGIRNASEKSTGVMAHLRTYDTSSLAYRQGTTRRGSYAAYLDISHPEIEMFLEMRKETGDPNLRAPNLHHGVNIPDSFMEIIERCTVEKGANDDWPLIEPNTGKVKKVVSAKMLWQKILELRAGETGEPYIHFIDTSNKHFPDFLKRHGLKVRQSNLCTEIILPTSADRTAVCCLSSYNLSYWDEYKTNYQFFRDTAEFIDNVLQYFIDHAPDTIARARYSAYRERSIGLGALGFHDYLQSKDVAFESVIAKTINNSIFKTIRTMLDRANLELGALRGEAPDAEGTGRRFSHVMAIAPNATSSIIMGNTSPSIEPYRANAYRQDTISGASLNKNRNLDKKIKEMCFENPKLDYDDIWSQIIAEEGSIQGIDIFDEHTKAVFKTAPEINQMWIIEHAADRQVDIDQGQSVNIFTRPDINVKELHAIHLAAWKKGLKTMYYCRSEKIAKADKVSKKIERKRIESIDLKAIASGDDCIACEG